MGNTNGRQSGTSSPRHNSTASTHHLRTFDGGSLAPHGIYPGKPDYNPIHVLKYIRERRLAPFYKGLDDYEETWTDDQLAAFVRDGKLPAVAEPPPLLPLSPVNFVSSVTPSPLGSPRPPSNSSTPSLLLPPSVDDSRPNSPRIRGMSVIETSSQHGVAADSSSNLSVSSRDKRSRPRAQTTGSSSLIPTRGKPLEAVVYRGAIECPVCFLFYPPNINRTRCCWKPICTECFVEMKRSEPHYPSNEDNPLPSEPGAPALNLNPMNLVSDPVRCPFCVKSDFGVVYNPPVWLPTDRKPDVPPREIATSPLQSTDHLPLDKREEMYPPGLESVVLSDNIRPDWYQHLAHRRRVEARRLATATALQQALAVAGQRRRGSATGRAAAGTNVPAASAAIPEPRRMVGRRVDGIVRITRDEADEMMLQEAIRQSLLTQEEERQKREEEESKKAGGADGTPSQERSPSLSTPSIIVPPSTSEAGSPPQTSPVSYHLPRLQPSTSTSPPASRSFFSAFRSRSGSGSSRHSVSPPTPTQTPTSRRPSSASNLHPPTPVVRRQPSLPEPLLSSTTSANLATAMHDSIIPGVDDSRPSISSPLVSNPVRVPTPEAAVDTGDTSSSTPPATSVSTSSTANEEISPVEAVTVPPGSVNGTGNTGLKTRGESGSIEEHEVVEVMNA